MGALPNQILIGSPANPDFVFDNASIANVGGVFGVDVVGNELTIDQVTAVVQHGRPPDPPPPTAYRSPDGRVYRTSEREIYLLAAPAAPAVRDLRTLPYGTPVWWRNNGGVVHAGFFKDVERTGSYAFRLRTISGVGLLASMYHKGAVYTGETFAEVAADIIGGAFPYSIAQAVAETKIYGWLPYDTRRNNLHQLLFAVGSALLKDADGSAQFVYLSAAAPTPVPNGRVAFGGSVRYESPASRAEVTEHAYLQTARDETVTLYDNTSGSAQAVSQLVVFDRAPAYGLTTTGTLVIEESGVNYAVVSGVGTIEGRLYTHATRVVVNENAAAGTEIVKRVTDMTLVSLANSSNVAKRVLAYYSSARIIRAELSLDGERCGDILSLSDPYFEPVTAFLASMEVNASTNLKAVCELVEGYTPTGQGNNVQNSELLTGSGVWTSPIDGDVTFVLIAGGQGGKPGFAGEDTPEPPISSESDMSSTPRVIRKGLLKRNLPPTAGGEPGEPGMGGKVYVAKMTVAKGQQIAFSCGLGGAGAAFGSDAGGAEGTATTFGGYSSDSGAVSATGYIDPTSGRQFAAPGDDGIAGGMGVGYVDDELWIPPDIVYNGVTSSAGVQGVSRTQRDGVFNQNAGAFLAVASGSLGGGPAAGSSGENGANGTARLNYVTNASVSYPWQAVAVMRKPGDGAAAEPPAKPTVPGKGGTGGNGGGGAGQFAWPTYAQRAYSSEATKPAAGEPVIVRLNGLASGGSGSRGGDGADGAILLFYGS